MNKLKYLILLMSAITAGCADITTDGPGSYLDANSDNYSDVMAADNNSDGYADAYQDDDGDGILNYADSNYWAINPDVYQAYYGEVYDDGNTVPDDTGGIIKETPGDTDTVEVEDPIVEGQPYISLTGGKSYYTVILGEAFDVATDVKFQAGDGDGNETTSEVVIDDGGFDNNVADSYTITLTYGDIVKTVTVDVIEETTIVTANGKFTIDDFTGTVDHDFLVDSDGGIVIKVEAGYTYSPPTITATVISTGEDARVQVKTSNEVSANDKLETTGTYKVYYNLIDNETLSNFVELEITIVVVGESSISFSGDELDFDKDDVCEFNVKLGESYTLPTATAADGEGNALTVTVDEGGFDYATEGEYTVVYTAKNGEGVEILVRTLVITVSDMERYELSSGEIEITAAGTYELTLTKNGTLFFAPGTGAPGEVTAVLDGKTYGPTWYMTTGVTAGTYVLTINVACRIGYQ